MIFPWSGTARYVAHLEAEVEYLRQQVTPAYRPPRAVEKHKPDPPPQKLVELCSRFDQSGPRILQECVQDRKQTQKPWEHYVREVESYFANIANVNGAGE